MKKLLIGALLITGFLNKTIAQEKFALYLAGNFGLSNAKLTPNKSDAKSKLSSGLGINAKLRLGKNFDLTAQPGASFRGYESSNAANDYDIKATYFDIPVDIEYHFTFGYMKGSHEEDLFFIGAGVYTGFALGGSFQDKYTNDPSKKLQFGEGLTDNRSATDFGLNFTAGLQNGKFRFGFQNQRGLKNVIPKDRQTTGAEIKLKNLSLFVAYKIHTAGKRMG